MACGEPEVKFVYNVRPFKPGSTAHEGVLLACSQLVHLLSLPADAELLVNAAEPIMFYCDCAVVCLCESYCEVLYKTCSLNFVLTQLWV